MGGEGHILCGGTLTFQTNQPLLSTLQRSPSFQDQQRDILLFCYFLIGLPFTTY